METLLEAYTVVLHLWYVGTFPSEKGQVSEGKGYSLAKMIGTRATLLDLVFIEFCTLQCDGGGYTA